MVSINLPADQDDLEFQEQFFVRLFNPKNGVTLTNNNLATLVISGRENNGVVSFNDESITLLENQAGTDVLVNRNGGTSGELRINYELLNASGTVTEDIESANGELVWADGDQLPKAIRLIPIDDQQTEAEESLTLQLSAGGDQLIGSPDEITVTIRDDESNTAPTANAGADSQYNVRQSATLNGVAQDSEGSSLMYQWQQESGSAVTISGADALNASFVAPSAPGTLEFSFTVTDEFGAANRDTIVVTIVAASNPPTSTPGSASSGGSLSWLSALFLAACLLARQKRVS